MPMDGAAFHHVFPWLSSRKEFHVTEGFPQDSTKELPSPAEQKKKIRASVRVGPQLLPWQCV